MIFIKLSLLWFTFPYQIKNPKFNNKRIKNCFVHCARPPDDVAHAFVMNHCIKYNNRIHSPSTGYHSNNISAEQKVFYLKKKRYLMTIVISLIRTWARALNNQANRIFQKREERERENLIQLVYITAHQVRKTFHSIREKKWRVCGWLRNLSWLFITNVLASFNLRLLPRFWFEKNV